MDEEPETAENHDTGDFAIADDFTAAGDLAATDLSHIPISICVELSRTHLSLKELGALKNGDVLELNKRPNEPIDLVVSGKVIGKGELVDVDGELGVRICSLVK